MKQSAMVEMTDAERKEIAESMDSMSEKLDSIVKMLNDIIRQNAVIYYSINHEDEKADVMSPKKMETPAPPKEVHITTAKLKAAMDTLDVGKVRALRKAGWKIQAIADDMGVTYSKVYRVLHEDQEGTGNG